MNGNGYDTVEDILLDEDIEEDELEALEELEDLEDYGMLEAEDDDAERRRRRRSRRIRPRRPLRTGGRRRYSRPRPSGRYVTQTQLQAALERVRKDVRTNGAAIKKVNARVNTVNTRLNGQADALKKEISERKKESAKFKSNLQMATLLPLLAKKSLPATTAAATVGGAAVPVGTKLATEGDSLSTLLPILLLGDGLGGSGSSDDSSNMLLLVLALSGGL